MFIIRLAQLVLAIGMTLAAGAAFAQPPELRPRSAPQIQPPPNNAPPVQPPNDQREIPPSLRKRAIPYTDDQLRAAMNAQQLRLPSLDLGEGITPPDLAARVFDPMGRPAAMTREDWQESGYHWMASGVWHHPLYFEDVMLERHGHSRHPMMQPFVSGARFFGSIGMLPYKMQLDPSRARFSTLGHHRPGSPVPAFIQRPRWRRDAAAVQAIGTPALIFAVP